MGSEMCIRDRAASCGLFFPCFPAPFPCRTRLENLPKRSEFHRPPSVLSFAAPRLRSSTRRSPAHTNLFTSLRTRTHRVAGGQPSSSPANTNLFTFLPDAQTPGCRGQPSTLRSFIEWFNARHAYFFTIPWVVCWPDRKGGGIGLTLPSHTPPLPLPSAPVAAVYTLAPLLKRNKLPG